MKSRNTINIAIIGNGSEGAYLVSALSECPSTTIVGFCDSDTDSPSTLAAQELNIPLFEKIEQLPSMGDVDLIIDASDGKLSAQSLESLGRVEVIRGRGADIIKALAEKRKGYSEDINNIFSTGFELASQKDSQSIYRALVESAIKITGSETGSLVIFDEKTEVCRLAEAIGYPKKFIDNHSWELQPGGITELLLDRRSPMLIPNVSEEPLFDNPVMNEGTISVLATALREADDVIGLLFVGDFKPKRFSDREIALFYAFAGQASLALQKALLVEKNEELTITDNLTGLNNIRHFFGTLDAEIKRAKRYGGYFSMLLLDLDNLNHINDCFGHAKGDWVIKKVSEIIVSCSRQTDYKARYGGDEFAMILPNTHCQQASVLANRIRRQVNDTIVEWNGEEAELSISIGIAEFPHLGADSDGLISAVNTALTICKQRGRNLVCCYEDTPEGTSMLS